MSLVATWLATHAHLEPALLCGPAFEHAVAERRAATGARDDAAYVALLASSVAECDHLVAGLAVPESWLFRYPQSYDLLVEHLAALATRRPADSVLPMLSAGCAAGQEACSMVIAAVHAGWSPERVHVEAVDRNPVALAQAEAGVYSQRSIRCALPAWAAPWLQIGEGTVRVDPTIRRTICYRAANLMDVEPGALGSVFDVVFCRNVLIYLGTAARARLLATLAERLAPGGLLFLGHAEHLPIISAWFTPVGRPHTFAFRPGVSAPSSTQARRDGVQLRPAPTPAALPTSWTTSLTAPGEPPPPRSPGSIARDATLEEATALADAGQLEEAQRVAQMVLARTGASAAVLELLGTICLARGELSAARDQLRKAVYLEPGREAALLQLAAISERMGDAGLAQRYRDRAQRIHRSEE